MDGCHRGDGICCRVGEINISKKLSKKKLFSSFSISLHQSSHSIYESSTARRHAHVSFTVSFANRASLHDTPPASFQRTKGIEVVGVARGHVRTDAAAGTSRRCGCGPPFSPGPRHPRVSPRIHAPAPRPSPRHPRWGGTLASTCTLKLNPKDPELATRNSKP